MRFLLQRVNTASVEVDKKIVGKISKGILVFVGIENEDNIEDIKWAIKKITNLRIFDDEKNIMNNSVNDIKGEILVISQFTLHANVKKGNRPSYIKASKPNFAEKLYTNFISELKKSFANKIEKGIFGANMNIKLENDGPVTIFFDSKQKNF